MNSYKSFGLIILESPVLELSLGRIVQLEERLNHLSVIFNCSKLFLNPISILYSWKICLQ